MAQSLTRLDFHRTRALLVDDSPHSAALMLQVLQSFRIEKVTACASAREARDAIGTFAFDLMIIDFEMPDEDGVSLTRHIRSSNDSQNSTTPIIMVSARPAIEKVTRARDAGANLVVRKPIVPAVLLQRIEGLARNTRQFVSSPSYCGPDRRFKNTGPPFGVDERRSDALALTACPDRAMSQDDIDALFG